VAKKKTPATKTSKSKSSTKSRKAKASASNAAASATASATATATKSKPKKTKAKAAAAPPAEAADTMAKTPPTKKKTGGTKPRTKKVATGVDPAASAAAAAAAVSSRRVNGEGSGIDELSVSQLKRAKSELTRKDKLRYRDLLLQKRAEILGDVESLQSDAKNNGGDISHMPVHMADVGSDYYEQEFTLGLVESERKLLREIDEALIRINDGYFGVCLASGRPIGKARLDAKPWAKYCIEVVRERERRGKW
jgi:RNA polymerase-binding transcription factor